MEIKSPLFREEDVTDLEFEFINGRAAQMTLHAEDSVTRELDESGTPIFKISQKIYGIDALGRPTTATQETEFQKQHVLSFITRHRTILWPIKPEAPADDHGGMPIAGRVM